MTIKLLTEHHLELLHLKGGCTGSSASTHVKIPHCWKSHVTAHFGLCLKVFLSLLLGLNILTNILKTDDQTNTLKIDYQTSQVALF